MPSIFATWQNVTCVFFVIYEYCAGFCWLLGSRLLVESILTSLVDVFKTHFRAPWHIIDPATSFPTCNMQAHVPKLIFVKYCGQSSYRLYATGSPSFSTFCNDFVWEFFFRIVCWSKVINAKKIHSSQHRVFFVSLIQFGRKLCPF